MALESKGALVQPSFLEVLVFAFLLEADPTRPIHTSASRRRLLMESFGITYHLVFTFFIHPPFVSPSTFHSQFTIIV
ncbi:hypothetical protein IMZ48_20285 [Candidatus Bathyarchaeota archaeon]|nr:hypothetical protein [Candidatus Bathyarchaeota archaeon]